MSHTTGERVTLFARRASRLRAAAHRGHHHEHRRGHRSRSGAELELRGGRAQHDAAGRAPRRHALPHGLREPDRAGQPGRRRRRHADQRRRRRCIRVSSCERSRQRADDRTRRTTSTCASPTRTCRWRIHAARGSATSPVSAPSASAATGCRTRPSICGHVGIGYAYAPFDVRSRPCARASSSATISTRSRRRRTVNGA